MSFRFETGLEGAYINNKASEIFLWPPVWLFLPFHRKTLLTLSIMLQPPTGLISNQEDWVVFSSRWRKALILQIVPNTPTPTEEKYHRFTGVRKQQFHYKNIFDKFFFLFSYFIYFVKNLYILYIYIVSQLIGLVWFYGISTFVGYLTPNPFLFK